MVALFDADPLVSLHGAARRRRAVIAQLVEQLHGKE